MQEVYICPRLLGGGHRTNDQLTKSFATLLVIRHGKDIWMVGWV